jgi:hypothetical protein
VARNFKTAVSTALQSRLGYLVERPSNALKAALLDYRYYCETTRLLSHNQDLLHECWEAILSEGLNLVPTEKQVSAEKFGRLAMDELKDALEKAGEQPKAQWIPVLDWWRNYNGDGAQVLKNAARVILCVQAGSSASEMSFSDTGRDVTKLRNRLGDDTLEMLLVTQSFLKSETDYDFEIFFERIQKLVTPTKKSEEQGQNEAEDLEKAQKGKK